MKKIDWRYIGECTIILILFIGALILIPIVADYNKKMDGGWVEGKCITADNKYILVIDRFNNGDLSCAEVDLDTYEYVRIGDHYKPR